MDRHPKRFRSAHDRFAEIDRGDPDACWPWRGHVTPTGYAKAARTWAHRWAYVTFIGPIPEGFEVDHICHNRSDCNLGSDCPHRRCVNPAHLEAVPGKVNKSRARERLTACPNGHVLTPDNLKPTKDGHRCRTCYLDAKRAFHHRHREVQNARRRGYHAEHREVQNQRSRDRHAQEAPEVQAARRAERQTAPQSVRDADNERRRKDHASNRERDNARKRVKRDLAN